MYEVESGLLESLGCKGMAVREESSAFVAPSTPLRVLAVRRIDALWLEVEERIIDDGECAGRGVDGNKS